jgi:crotonobetainyl-CoA:carnitine CoA-transferase CaiB-like acyl-CoA transferase
MSTPAGDVAAMNTPLVIDGTRPYVRRGPRRFAEDTDEIFGD